ncbi:hypothetical protein DMENIID0001_094700 [Sergentomyia squamirostris]
MSDWSVAKYKTSHEPDEQWLLRKAFMERYKDELSEDEVVCLAQTMINIEFLGCRYPKETMLRVQELSEEILKDFRDKRKNRLKRTFVAASDAASAKVKRTSLPDTLKKTTESSEEPPAKRLLLPDDIIPTELPTFTSKFGKIVIYDSSSGHGEQSAISILQTIRSKCVATVSEVPGIDTQEGYRMDVLVNGKLAGSAVGRTKITARRLAYENALNELKKHCYTLCVKNFFVSGNVDTVEKLEEGAKKADSDKDKLGEDNLGFKLLKSLGWKGGSLGTKNDGIVNPVELSVNIGRQGLGATTNTDYYRNILRNYKNTATLYDLVFTNDFSSEERAVLHKLAGQLGLKSKSYSRNEERHLVISKKVTIFDIATDIVSRKDPALLEKFTLLPPQTESRFFPVLP